MVGFVEGDNGAGTDADDFAGISSSSWGDLTVSKVDATGEYVLTVGGGDGLFQFGFDPNYTGDPLVNGDGALSYIGYDKGSAEGPTTYGTDTDASGSPVAISSNQTEFNVLPDGKVLTTDVTGLWIADPGFSVVCFAAGTLIETDAGAVKVEELKQGDMVMTKDNGLKPVRWIGKRAIGSALLSARENLRPIRIRAGALGVGLPEQDLYVSQQHRILLKSKVAARMMGFDEVLVPAKKLVGIDGIEIVSDCDDITYVHFLFDQHEIVFSNGAETESLFTGPEALRAVTPEAREEIMALFPELAEMNYDDLVGVRIIPSGKIAKKLVSRIRQNNKPLYETRH